MQARSLTQDERIVWKAIRLRLSHHHPWAIAPVMRCIPVAVVEHPGTVDADMWGRVYLDFGAEQHQGIGALAEAVLTAIMQWMNQTTIPQPWHVRRDHPDFQALGGAETAETALQAATRLLGTALPDSFSQDYKQQMGWRQWAQQMAGAPQVSWTSALAAHMRRACAWQAGVGDYTYSRPSRRQLASVILPALRRRQLHIGIVADVSPSIVDQLDQVMVEIERIGRAVGVASRAVTVYATDHEMIASYTLGTRVLPLPTRQGSSTDLRVGITAALAAPQRPNVMIVLTDGFTPWPDAPIAVPMIVALIGDRHERRIAHTDLPVWADSIDIDTTKAPI